MGSRGGENSWQGAMGRTRWARWQLADRAVPHSHVDKPGGTTGEGDRLHIPGFQHGEMKPQNLWLGWLSGLSLQIKERVIGLIPSQGTCLGCRPGSLVWLQEATTHWCFSPSLSPSLPLCLKIKIKSWKKKKNWFDRERHQFVVLLIYAFIGCFLYVS